MILKENGNRSEINDYGIKAKTRDVVTNISINDLKQVTAVRNESYEVIDGESGFVDDD